jgi:hypothetical protein
MATVRRPRAASPPGARRSTSGDRVARGSRHPEEEGQQPVSLDRRGLDRTARLGGDVAGEAAHRAEHIAG